MATSKESLDTSIPMKFLIHSINLCLDEQMLQEEVCFEAYQSLIQAPRPNELFKLEAEG